MSEQPEDKPRVRFDPPDYATSCMDIEQPESISDGAAMVLTVEFDPPTLPIGELVTMRLPDGTRYAGKITAYDGKEDVDGECRERYTLGGIEPMPSEP